MAVSRNDVLNKPIDLLFDEFKTTQLHSVNRFKENIKLLNTFFITKINVEQNQNIEEEIKNIDKLHRFFGEQLVFFPNHNNLIIRIRRNLLHARIHLQSKQLTPEEVTPEGKKAEEMVEWLLKEDERPMPIQPIKSAFNPVPSHHDRHQQLVPHPAPRSKPDPKSVPSYNQHQKEAIPKSTANPAPLPIMPYCYYPMTFLPYYQTGIVIPIIPIPDSSRTLAHNNHQNPKKKKESNNLGLFSNPSADLEKKAHRPPPKGPYRFGK